MSAPILSSTFLLTLLLAVGLVFFIRASVKDRIEEVKLLSEQAEETLLTELQQYFSGRSYRVAAVDRLQNQVTFEGYVQPSWFMAIFLSLLAAVGSICLALVVAMLWPGLASVVPLLLLFAPAAGVFYWQRAGRVEKVSIKVEAFNSEDTQRQNLITVKAHRDELAELKRVLPLSPCESL